jgi:hypothetical protein
MITELNSVPITARFIPIRRPCRARIVLEAGVELAGPGRILVECRRLGVP